MALARVHLVLQVKLTPKNGGKIHVRDAWTEHEKAGVVQGGGVSVDVGVSVGGCNFIVLQSKLMVE